MIKAACHCGAVRYQLAKQPEWVLDCNCTLCRRYGAIWHYPDAAQLVEPPTGGATDTYTWQEGHLAFHRCKVCGCVTHMLAAKEDPPVVYGVNARLIPTLDPANTEVRQYDNSHTGRFWTKSELPIRASRHPPMPLPGPDDWR